MQDELQALVTGAILAALVEVQRGHLSIDVEPQYDSKRNYLPEIVVTGLVTGTRLRVVVEVIDSPGHPSGGEGG